jgi:hypothetical protein
MRSQRGQTAAEYLGLLLLVAAIIGAIFTVGIGGTISGAVRSAVCQVMGADDCGTPAHARPPGATKGDSDGDGIPNAEERRTGLNPESADTDGDGVADGKEVVAGTDPRKADTDGDGLDDRQEAATGGKLDPTKADTDGDGLTDGEETAIGTDPTSQDSDGFDTVGDGLTDKQELELGTDPNNFDSDGDGNPDGYEVRKGDNPTDDERSLLQKGVETFFLDDPISLFIPTGALGKVVGKAGERLALEAKAAYSALKHAKTLKEAAAARRRLLALYRERVTGVPGSGAAGSDAANSAPEPEAAGGGKGQPPSKGRKLPPLDVDPWTLKPTDRGKAIEARIARDEYRKDLDWYNIGATRGGTFPTVDFQHGQTALSLKTLDPQLPSAGRDLFKHIDTLRDADITINHKPAIKVLDIRVPPGQSGAPILTELTNYGRRNKIQVIVKEYP